MKKTLVLLFFNFSLLTCFAHSWQKADSLRDIYINQQVFDTALIYAEKAAELVKDEFSEMDTLYADMLLGLLYVNYYLGKPAEAIKYGEKEKNIRLKIKGNLDTKYNDCLNNLAEIYGGMGKYDKAFPLSIEALENTEISLGKEHSKYGYRLNNLAELYRQTGEYDKAISLLKESLENTENSLGKDSYEYGVRLNNLALSYRGIGEYNKALPLYIKALENTEKTLGKNHPWYGIALANLATLYGTIGQYDKALILFLESLENTKNALGKNHPWYGYRLNNLAELYRETGKFDKAISLYIESIENAELNFGKNHPSYASRLSNLALMYSQLGQYDNALPLYKESIEITKNALGSDHPEYAVSLNNLGELYYRMGKHEKALSLFLENVEIVKNSLGKEHFAYARGLNNLAGLYQEIGKPEKAMPLYQVALENIKNSLGKDHAYYGNILNNLAESYWLMDSIDKSLALYDKSLENVEKSLGENHLWYAGRANSIAGLYYQTNHYEKALELYIKSNNSNLHNIDRAFAFLSESQKENYIKTISNNFSSSQSFYSNYAKTKPEIGGKSYNIELATKGLILRSGIQMRQSILNSGDIKVLEKYDEWVKIRSGLASQYSLSVAERNDDMIISMEKDAQILESELTRLSSSFQQVTALGNVNWQDIQKQLSSNEYAVEFASFNYRHKNTWTDSIKYIAIVLGYNYKHPEIIKLCEQRQLDSLINKGNLDDFSYVNNLYKGIGSSLHLKEGEIEYGDRLYKLVWEPLTSYIEEGSTVYFAPSGSLHQIAFAAVPYQDNQRLSDVYDLRQLSTTAMLLEKEDDLLFNSIALFGGINYEVEENELLAIAENIQPQTEFISRSLPDDIDRGNINWTYLPGTLYEVETISYLANKNNYNTTLYTGNNALEENFKILSGKNSPDIVHIATHGFYFSDQVESENEERELQDKSVFQISDDPLNRTGLLFAGANHTWRGELFPGGIEDGILTAYEVSNVSLLNTDLVVLSACETGLGDIRGSEGVFGLQRAFKAAGAKYLLMSLWKVPDNETAMFMEYFYKQIFSGESVSDSFRKAQDFMKNKFPLEPYKWAAFVLVK